MGTGSPKQPDFNFFTRKLRLIRHVVYQRDQSARDPSSFYMIALLFSRRLTLMSGEQDPCGFLRPGKSIRACHCGFGSGHASQRPCPTLTGFGFIVVGSQQHKRAKSGDPILFGWTKKTQRHLLVALPDMNLFVELWETRGRIASCSEGCDKCPVDMALPPVFRLHYVPLHIFFVFLGESVIVSITIPALTDNILA